MKDFGGIKVRGAKTKTKNCETFVAVVFFSLVI